MRFDNIGRVGQKRGSGENQLEWSVQREEFDQNETGDERLASQKEVRLSPL